FAYPRLVRSYRRESAGAAALRLPGGGRRALRGQARPRRSAAPRVRAAGARPALGSRGLRRAARGARRSQAGLSAVGRRDEPRLLRPVREGGRAAEPWLPAAQPLRRGRAAAGRAGGRTAFVLVDALRFEMAQGLAEELSKEKVRVSLTARLAELPTITAVGMNALAPVERDGRLRLLLDQGSPAGFVAREFAVKKPTDRVRAIEQRSLGEGALDMELADFLELDGKQLEQRVKGKPLIVVRSLELDTAGEHALHLGTFEQTLTQLKSAISRLRRAGVDRFVITSDHGFLLQDPTTDNVPFGVSKRVPKRRHALLAEPSGMADVLEVKLSALGYEVEGCEENEDLYLVLRPDTALWQTKDKVAPFVHGGNSLQER